MTGQRGEPAHHVGGDGTEPIEQADVVECPQCHATNLGDASFCEACGYDLVTGVEPPRPGSDELPPTRLQSASPHQVYVEGDLDRDAAEESQHVILPSDPFRDEVAGEAGARPEVPPATPPPPGQTAQAHEQPDQLPPSLTTDRDWVVELWVDASWYATRETDQPCPELGVPTVIPLTSHNVVIGRTSVAQGLHPDIDCGTDVGVSVRHAQLTSDGRRWWVEDLDTSNGTYAGVVGEDLPTEPVEHGRRVEIDQADRVWLGSWTRLNLRAVPPA